jgi:ADP-ribosylglycohydrolase
MASNENTRDYGDVRVSYLPHEEDLLNPILVNMKQRDFLDRLLGCIYGQALGDAYGLSTEFQTHAQIQSTYPNLMQLIPFPDYIQTPHAHRWKQGDWTDDTDQWVLVMETLIDANSDAKTFARKLSLWVRQGFPELNDFGGLGLGINVAQVKISSLLYPF